MNIEFSTQFRKQYKKLSQKGQEQFKARLKLFSEDQTHAQLHIHKLAGEYDGLWSMNVSGDIRAVYDKDDPIVVLFVAIGSHSDLYS